MPLIDRNGNSSSSERNQKKQKLPSYPSTRYSVYRCVSVGSMGSFYVERPSSEKLKQQQQQTPVHHPIYVAEACMVYDTHENEVNIFDTNLICLADVNWTGLTRCIELIRKVATEDVARIVLEPTHDELWHKACVAAGMEPRHVVHGGWMMKDGKSSPRCAFLRKQKGVPDLKAFAEQLVERERTLTDAYPMHALGSEDIADDFSRLNHLIMRFAPDVSRDTGDPETRIRPINDCNVPNSRRGGVREHQLRKISDGFRHPPLSYREVAIGVIMQRHRCSLSWARTLWFKNSRNIFIDEQEDDEDAAGDPTNVPARVLLNYADIVLGARNVTKHDACENVLAPKFSPRYSSSRSYVCELAALLVGVAFGSFLSTV